MKFISYEQDGRAVPGVLSPDGAFVLPLQAALGRPIQSMVDFICGHTDEELQALRARCDLRDGPRLPVAQVRLLAPIQRPVHDILCVGTNYIDHVREVQKEIDPALVKAPKETIYFSKRACHIIGPSGAVESHRSLDPLLDYEVELAVVIGKEGRDIPLGDTESYVFGYSVFNDFSARTLQRAHVQWFRGKSLDTFSAMGPCIVHKSALPYPVEVGIRSTVNGELRQDANTRLLLTGLADIIHTLSSGITLEPGDIIATGTPAGAGMGFDPPRYLSPGDTVCCEIDGIGSLTNTVQ